MHIKLRSIAESMIGFAKNMKTERLRESDFVAKLKLRLAPFFNTYKFLVFNFQ